MQLDIYGQFAVCGLLVKKKSLIMHKKASNFTQWLHSDIIKDSQTTHNLTVYSTAYSG